MDGTFKQCAVASSPPENYPGLYDKTLRKDVDNNTRMPDATVSTVFGKFLTGRMSTSADCGLRLSDFRFGVPAYPTEISVTAGGKILSPMLAFHH